MIRAIVKRKNGIIISVKLSGHANSVDEGYDMVCSAVSAVSLTIANGITDILKVNPSISMEDGFLSINLSDLCDCDIVKCQVLLETMTLGFKSIEYSYDDYIKVMEEEV